MSKGPLKDKDIPARHHELTGKGMPENMRQLTGRKLDACPADTIPRAFRILCQPNRLDIKNVI